MSLPTQNYSQIGENISSEERGLIHSSKSNTVIMVRRLMLGIAIVFGFVTIIAITRMNSQDSSEEVGKDNLKLGANAVATSASRSSSCPSTSCLAKYNINGRYSQTCVECEDCNAVVFNGMGAVCMRNAQGSACKNVVYDGATPKCMDYCASAIAYVNGRPQCITNNAGRPCSHMQYQTYNGQLTPICTDDCPSQDAVVRTIWGKIVCVRNAQGGACKNIINPMMGDPYCGDGHTAASSSGNTAIASSSGGTAIASSSPFGNTNPFGNMGIFAYYVPESSCTGEDQCYQTINYNGIQSAACVECPDCNAVVFDMYSGSQCLRNDQGGACQKILYDGVTPKCFDACPNSVVYTNGKPECQIDPQTGLACQNIVATLGGMKCMDSCPDQKAVVSTGMDAVCVLNDQGQACSNIVFGTDMKPVCMDSCPSQSAVAFTLWGQPQCVLNAQGGACENIAYSLNGQLYCNEGVSTSSENTNDVATAIVYNNGGL